MYNYTCKHNYVRVAAAEKSFSTLRQDKTLLYSIMTILPLYIY